MSIKTSLRFFSIMHEFGSLLIFYISLSKDENRQQKLGKRLRLACEKLGPTYIKLGQILSMRPDFIPQEWCLELENLLDHAPAVPIKKIKTIINMELKKPVEMLFKNFNDKPIASASLSQVHLVTLISGKKAVIKVLRPDIKKLVKSDIRCLQCLAKIFKNYLPMESNQAKELLFILGQWLETETNFENEVNNMLIMSRELGDSSPINIPAVYKDYSTKNILTMEYIKGYTMLDLIRLKRKNKDKKLLFSTQDILEKLIEEVGINGLLRPHFHADLHPANIIISSKGAIYLIDFGLIQYFDERMRKNNTLLMLGIAYASPELILFASKKIGSFPAEYDEKIIFAELSELCNQYNNSPAFKMSTSQLLVAVINMGLKHKIIFPWPLILYTRSAMHLDGMILNLAPEFIFSKYAQNKFLNIYSKMALNDMMSIPSFLEKAEKIIEMIK